MTDKEFENRMSTLDMVKAQIDSLKAEVADKNKSSYEDTNDAIKIIAQRNDNFSKYIDLLKEFSFSDNLTSPSDLFPGIRTTSDMADPEELRAKTENMKQYASSIDSASKQLDVILSRAIQNIKQGLGMLNELAQLENEYYSLCLDLLKDMDSIYDIGQLSSMT